MKQLILLTQSFPYGKQETFLENEIPWLSRYFNLSIICSNDKFETKRDIDPNIKVWCVNSGFQKLSLLKKLKHAIHFLFSKYGLAELKDIFSKRKLVLARIKNSAWVYAQAQEYYKTVSETGIIPSGEVLIYSYWSTSELLAFTLHKSSKWTIVTRMHGYDLYNERNQYGRQPFKKQMDKALDAGMFISEYGLDYYIKNYSLNGKASEKPKLSLFRLGTIDYGMTKQSGNGFLICSCSNIIRIKRVELIVKALSLISDRQIRWVHFGDDEGFGSDGNYQEVLSLTKSLPSNIKADFMGRIPNQDVLDFYLNNSVSCFITTSSTEGCPVSLMEALSMGIPIIATAVGGIPEMIDGSHNILLDKNPQVTEIQKAIEAVMDLSDDGKAVIRDENRMIWKKRYCAESNNKEFVSFLESL